MAGIAGRRPFNKSRTITQAQTKATASERYKKNAGMLPIPEHLDEEEAEIWDDVLRQAPAGALHASSHYVLEMFCYQICQIRQIRSEMKQLKEAKSEKPDHREAKKESKATTPTTSLTILHNGRVAPNPLLTAYRSAVATASQLSNTLGLTGGGTRKQKTTQEEEEERAEEIARGKGQGLHSGRVGLIGPMAMEEEDDGSGTGSERDFEGKEKPAGGSRRSAGKARSRKSK